MKRLYICYALETAFLTDLESRLMQITLGAMDQNIVTFAYIRDVQKWYFHNEPIKEVLATAFQEIEASDALLLDLTANLPSTKRTGLNIESGYAAALHKPIFALWRTPDRPSMTTDLAVREACYSTIAEIRQRVAEMLAGFRQDR